MKSTKSYLQWILDKSAKSSWDAKCFNTSTKSHLGNMNYGHKPTKITAPLELPDRPITSYCYGVDVKIHPAE